MQVRGSLQRSPQHGGLRVMSCHYPSISVAGSLVERVLEIRVANEGLSDASGCLWKTNILNVQYMYEAFTSNPS